MAAAGTYGWFELVGLFAFSLQKGSQMMPVLSKEEAQLSLHRHNIAKRAPKHRNGKKPVDNDVPAKVRNCTGVTALHVP